MQQLRPSDPKCQFILTVRESRIHFVISAGTPSDPPIRIVDMENLEDELHDATEEFLNKTVKVSGEAQQKDMWERTAGSVGDTVRVWGCLDRCRLSTVAMCFFCSWC